MRLQVVSDLHLERPDGSLDVEIPALAPYLALLGDIGDPFSTAYATFVRNQAARFKRVFVVLGNHEWYHCRESALEQARALAGKHPNVHVLEKDCVEVDGLRVLGTTLWSDMDYQTACFMSDFRCIYGWTHAKSLEEHRSCVRWLEKELACGRPSVVLTHHAPLQGCTSRPEHRGGVFESGFTTDLTHLVRAPVKAWFHGHTHWSHETMKKGVLVASNAAGLAGETTRFDPSKVFTVE